MYTVFQIKVPIISTTKIHYEINIHTISIKTEIVYFFLNIVIIFK